MSRQQAFEAIYAKQHDVPAESLVQYRHKSKEGYNLPGIASHYRTYCEALDSIVVELPERIPKDNQGDYWTGAANGFNQAIDTFAIRIKQSGIKVKS